MRRIPFLSFAVCAVACSETGVNPMDKISTIEDPVQIDQSEIDTANPAPEGASVCADMTDTTSIVAPSGTLVDCDDGVCKILVPVEGSAGSLDKKVAEVRVRTYGSNSTQAVTAFYDFGRINEVNGKIPFYFAVGEDLLDQYPGQGVCVVMDLLPYYERAFSTCIAGTSFAQMAFEVQEQGGELVLKMKDFSYLDHNTWGSVETFCWQ